MRILPLKQSERSPYKRLAIIAAALAVIIGGTYSVQLNFAKQKSTADTDIFDAIPTDPNNGVTTVKQTVINDDKGEWLATFTQGARTVIMRGPKRTFSEPTSTTVTITTDKWVRLYPGPYRGSVDQDWLKAVTEENKQSVPDIIATAMLYIPGAKTVKNDSNQIISSDAGYGPLLPNGDREEGADFNDYLGIPYKYRDNTDQPEPRFLGNLDNVGFLRMVWGFGGSLPMSLGDDTSDLSIPRQAHQFLEVASGIVVDNSPNQQISDFSRLQIGDIILNDTNQDNGARIDFAGMYLGKDSQGNHRFIASRPAPNGPTFGDIGGRSILDGNGSFARSFKAVRRF